MKNVLQALKVVEEFVRKDNNVISVDWNTEDQRMRVHYKSENYIDLVEENNIIPCFVDLHERNCEKFNYQLNVEIEGILFFCIMDEHEYEAEFREWHTEEPNIDETFIVDTPRGMTSNQVSLRDVGMNLYRDFL